MTALFQQARSALGMLAFLAWTPLMIGVYSLALALGRGYRRVAAWWARGCLTLVGVRMVVHGRPWHQSGDRPVLYVANHASYLDIMVLMALCEAAFVSKAEVRTWPGINLIARLGRTVYVSRSARRSRDERDLMGQRLAERESLVLFPEGTSSDGNRVLPFKSALFSVAERQRADGSPLPVQPVTLAYTRLYGLPLGRNNRWRYAWYGDMALVPHLWRLFATGPAVVEVTFHDPVRFADFAGRKPLAEHCRAVVAGEFSRRLGGAA